MAAVLLEALANKAHFTGWLQELTFACVHVSCCVQAHDFFSDAEEAAEDAAEAVKDKAASATSSGPSRAVPRPSGLYGKDPTPSNTEDVENWRHTHPQTARATTGNAENAKQAAKDSWESAKGHTRNAADGLKGKAQRAADDAKGKAADVKAQAKESAEGTKEQVEETADGVTAWAKSWFGEYIAVHSL